MIEQETRPCPQGLDSATLSALRDAALPAAELRRLREHTATCESCQTWLAGFERIQRALRRQPELEPGNRIWLAVRARAMTTLKNTPDERRDGFRPGFSGRPSTASLRGLAAAASILLVVGLLAAVLAHAAGSRPATVAAPTPTATISLPTATPNAAVVPGPQLVWRSATYPGHDTSAAAPVVAPSNGDVAYVCVENDSGPDARVYVTRNGGASWSVGGGLPVGAQPSGRYSLECYIMVDSNNPATVVIDAGWTERGAGDTMSEYANYATFDYGAHWAKLAYSQPLLLTGHLASYQGSYYAAGMSAMPGGTPQLWVSHDQLHSWTPITLPNNTQPQALWLNPKSGVLLLGTGDQTTNNPFLLQSADGGASWQTLVQANVPVAWIVQTPFSAGPWHICRWYGNALLAVSCSVNSGQTWTWYHLPWSPAVTPKGAPDIELPTVFAIATNGSLIAQDQLGTQDVVSLTPDSIVWQDLGPAPLVWNPFEVGPGGYAPTPSGGILWLGDGTETATYPGV